MKKLVYGVSKHKGNFKNDSGEVIIYDFAKIYTIAPMQQSATKKGSGAVDLKCEPHVFDQLKDVNFKEPVDCEIEMDMRSQGGGNMGLMVVNVKPIK